MVLDSLFFLFLFTGDSDVNHSIFCLFRFINDSKKNMSHSFFYFIILCVCVMDIVSMFWFFSLFFFSLLFIISFIVFVFIV